LHGDDLLRKKLELVAERKREARQACDLLGVERIAFLDAPDGKLNSSPGLVPKLRDVLLETRPEIVYVPFFLDAHPDHRAASCWFLEASRAAGLDPLCMAYEVWTPLAPTCIVPIDEVMEVKRRAIRCYASQLAGNDYEHKIAGLNAYRAMMLESRDARFAECYFSGPVASYRRLYEAYCKGNGPA
jgi:LmbE family N-acetylglucosaminyl deacetylase